MKSKQSKQSRQRAGAESSDVAGPGAAPFGALLGLVFCSGFAALVYELLWFRKLGLVFGNTVQAAATVLAAFMVGLAFGAHRARHWVAGGRNPVRMFGLIEAGIGFYALLVPAAFALASLGYQWAARPTPQAIAMLTALRFGLALLVLFVPTMLMGASLPVLVEAALRSRDRFAAKLGVLYGANTAGATLGVLACGFLLVPQLGVFATNLLAAGINLAVGGVACFLLRPKAATEIQSRPRSAPPAPASRAYGWLAVAAMCGGLALAFETVWFRALVLVFGSTSHSFAIMVACFLLGLAIGAAALGWVAERRTSAIWALVIALAAIGLWTFLSMSIYSNAPEHFLKIVARHNFSWRGMLLAKALLGAVFLLPLAMLSGMAFTAVVRLIRESTESAGRAVGAAFGVNALGSALGAAIAGFILLPAVGLEESLFVLGCTAVATGLLIPWLGGVKLRSALTLAAVVLTLAVGVRRLAAPWDPLLLSSGPYFAARENMAGGEVRLRERLQTIELVLYREGATSTVDVKRSAEGRLYFSSDGKVEADTSPESMVLQRMMGHLPMLLHPNPRRALNIGLGAGVTAGALSCYPELQLEVADIEPAVREVAALWSSRNHDLIRRGRFQLVINDGRNHLLVTTNRYDVITSDPFEPVVAGAASLYTVDHFALARSRLTPGGVMAQFLPLYELSRDDLLIILRSFLRVFPRSRLFFTGTDTILLGMTGNPEFQLATVTAKLDAPEVRASLAEIGITRPEHLIDMLVLDFAPGNTDLEAGAVNTDDRPIIEFSAPKSALDYRPDINQQVLLDRFGDLPPAYLAELAPDAITEVQRGRAGLRTLLQASLRRSQGDLEGGIKLLKAAHQLAPNSPIIRNELSKSLMLTAGKLADPEKVIALCQEALRVDPTDFWAIYKLALHAVTTKQWAQADEYLHQGLAAYPEAALLLALRGQRAGAAGDAAAACRDYEVVVRKLPNCGVFWGEYAAFLELAGRPEDSKVAIAHANRRQTER